MSIVVNNRPDVFSADEKITIAVSPGTTGATLQAIQFTLTISQVDRKDGTSASIVSGYFITSTVKDIRLIPIYHQAKNAVPHISSA